jgi:hypothetical protein
VSALLQQPLCYCGLLAPSLLSQFSTIAFVTRLLRDGWTALHISAKKNHTEMAELLLQHGINVDAKKKYSHFCASSCYQAKT